MDSHIVWVGERPDSDHPPCIAFASLQGVWEKPPPTPRIAINVFDYEKMAFLIMRRCGVDTNRDDDMYQIAMMALVRAGKGFRPELGFKFTTYAWRAVFEAVDRELKKRRRHDQIDDRPPFMQEGVEDRGVERLMNRQRVAMILKRLRKKERRILYDRYFKWRTLDEVSRANGVSKERIRQIQYSTLKRIREEMAA